MDLGQLKNVDCFLYDVYNASNIVNKFGSINQSTSEKIHLLNKIQILQKNTYLEENTDPGKYTGARNMWDTFLFRLFPAEECIFVKLYEIIITFFAFFTPYF